MKNKGDVPFSSLKGQTFSITLSGKYYIFWTHFEERRFLGLNKVVTKMDPISLFEKNIKNNFKSRIRIFGNFLDNSPQNQSAWFLKVILRWECSD